MSPLAVGLVLVSCFMHAGWNLLARGGRSERAFFGRMLLISAVGGALPAAAAELVYTPLPARAWLCVVGSGICCGGYYVALARAYGSSDFTVVYPVARSLPVLLVAVGDVLRGRLPTPLGWLGMLLVVAGCILAPLRSFRDVSRQRYWRRASLWMLLTALATVGYTLLDKLAAEAVPAGAASAGRYGYFFFLFSYLAYVGLNRVGGGSGATGGAVAWRLPFLAAVLNFGAYWLVLWAYQLDPLASYLLALRQFSIVLGVVAAFALYKEKGVAVRLTGTALIATGLVLIAVWGG